MSVTTAEGSSIRRRENNSSGNTGNGHRDKYGAAVPDTDPVLVFGDENLADEDAFVLLMYGDGFTAEEQDTFYSIKVNSR
ncbi:MAG: hypothetical protein PUB22_01150 [Clostridiales bacterium]|nr:hypothetical protein [Clostridiales bacterium]